MPLPRLEILLFDVLSPPWWIRRCKRVFEWYGVVERQKVTVAAVYLNDASDAWYQGWSKVRGECRWDEFAEELCERFGD